MFLPSPLQLNLGMLRAQWDIHATGNCIIHG